MGSKCSAPEYAGKMGGKMGTNSGQNAPGTREISQKRDKMMAKWLAPEWEGKMGANRRQIEGELRAKWGQNEGNSHSV